MEDLYCDTGDDFFSDTGDGQTEVGFDEAGTDRTRTGGARRKNSSKKREKCCLKYRFILLDQ